FMNGCVYKIIVVIQDRVVGHFGCSTPGEFFDVLVLGQLSLSPVLMIAGYVGYKLAGLAGAAVAATAPFLPSFVIMLAILPILDRVRQMTWVKAVTKGMSPAVIGVLAGSWWRLPPAAFPAPSATAFLIVSVYAR